jgi:hypothetical protein
MPRDIFPADRQVRQEFGSWPGRECLPRCDDEGAMGNVEEGGTCSISSRGCAAYFFDDYVAWNGEHVSPRCAVPEWR